MEEVPFLLGQGPAFHLCSGSHLLPSLFILLSTFTNIKDGRIPITFILVAIIYMGQQVYEGIFVQDNISNLTHILGGLAGTGLGFVMYKSKMNRY